MGRNKKQTAKKPGRPRKAETKAKDTKMTTRLAPSLSRGLFVIYNEKTDEILCDTINPIFRELAKAIAESEALTFNNRQNAEFYLRQLREDFALGVNNCEECESAEVVTLDTVAHTHYELDEKGHLKMELRDIHQDATEYRTAKKSARDRLMEKMKKEKETLKTMVKQFEQMRQEQMKKIMDAEKIIERFDRKAIHGKAN